MKTAGGLLLLSPRVVAIVTKASWRTLSSAFGWSSRRLLFLFVGPGLFLTLCLNVARVGRHVLIMAPLLCCLGLQRRATECDRFGRSTHELTVFAFVDSPAQSARPECSNS
ncbi:hypothetical protein JOL62DRAFT_161935 [Phyllosticta paracitricarpa]|uniref:Secreted protein n=2 Tax=Phyllosticta TaxID=121621 RepID=A0ABR1MPA7_9PEZI